jgi:hypothetical protein
MPTDSSRPRKPPGGGIDQDRLDRVVADARRAREARQLGYREQSLKLHPWVCARCGREFNRANLHELTVHHKDHNHDNNPPDGSNWENLCLYCHDNEHQKYGEFVRGVGTEVRPAPARTATHNPFDGLRELLGRADDED